MAHHGGMFKSAPARFTATLLVSVLGFVLTLINPYEADIGSTPTDRAQNAPKR